MPYRLDVLAHKDDGRGKIIEQNLQAKGHEATVRIADVYVSEHEALQSKTFIESVANPVTQSVNNLPGDFDWALEIGFLPGVTDNVGHTAQEILQLAGAVNDNACYSSRLYLIKGNLTQSDIEALAHELANPLIQRIQIKDAAQFKAEGGMDVVVPKVVLDNKGAVADEVDLDLSDEDLERLGKDGILDADGSRRGPLGLSLHYLKAIKAYFKETENRKPKDIELEMLAQSWSEHCKHTIFASPIDEIKDGIYKHYIKRATQEIRKNRAEGDFCVSVFSDNAGGIVFDENWLITDKVETHNSPSALDPFGGAITGIVGVNRDCVGFGKGAKPVINRYGFCFADPRTNPKYYRDQEQTQAVLSPETIMNGVVHGVHVGGNCSGIPTPQGFAYFDERYIGKPLVFVGTVGLIPREINGTPGHEKKARPGDKIMMVGGRVGRDGIHGATFSSVELDESSPATAVQIGDPITQKKFSDAIIKELRDTGWYSAITDNGAGGLSSSVGEMAEQSGGFHVELEKVPLKYPGMAPWEIWISESQERMTLAVPPENVQKIIELLARRGSEATVVGTYTDTGRAQVSWLGETIMDMEMDFLHDGLPETPLTTTFTSGGEPEPVLSPLASLRAKGEAIQKRQTKKLDCRVADAPRNDGQTYEAVLLNMLSRLNICSKEFIATQYDHNVQGSAVLGPLQGPGRLYAETTITKPVLTSPKGIVLSQGLAPRYSDIDTYHMAANALDMAVRNAVTAGGDFNHLALLDNFCWCSSDEPERLGQLKRAAEAIYELAVLFGTPFISGKDSMFNDFKGFDENGKPVKISIPPTLLVSSIGVIPHVDQAISPASKAVGDTVYLLGETKDELGGSEYYDHLGCLGKNVPQVNGEANYKLYKVYSRAARKHLIASALPVNFGGLGVTLAKKAIAGRMGLDIDLSGFDLDMQRLLFSESAGRILVTVAPQNVKAFEKMFKNVPHVTRVGHVAYGDQLTVKGVLQESILAMEAAYKAPLRNY